MTATHPPEPDTRPVRSNGDGHPCRALVRDMTEAAVRQILRRPRCDGGRDADEVPSEVQPLLRRVCEAARAQGLYPEQLLVLLKTEWRAVSEARQLARDEGEALLSHVVTLCIHEYYAWTSDTPTEDGEGR